MNCEHDLLWDKSKGNGSVVVCTKCGHEREYYYDEDAQMVLSRVTKEGREITLVSVKEEAVIEQITRPKKVIREELLELGPKGYAEKYGYEKNQKAFLFNLYNRWSEGLPGTPRKKQQPKSKGSSPDFSKAFETIRELMPEPGTPLTYDQQQGLTEMTAGAIKVMYPIKD